MIRKPLSRLMWLVLCGAPLAATAADGALEINQDCIAVGCFAGDSPGYPVTITQPGTYVLTSDLAPAGNQFVETIVATVSWVDIDLNGHTIEGGATCAGTPVAATCSGFTGYTGIKLGNGGQPGVYHVHNGRIHGFRAIGVSANDFATGTVLEDLVLSENAFGIAAAGVTGTETVHIRHVDISRNSTSGISTFGGGGNATYYAIVEDSTAIGNGAYGMYVGQAVLRGNTINDNLLAGLNCVGTCSLSQNAFRHNAGGGISAQWTGGTVKEMIAGSNICFDHSPCP